jgi:hypothetical protein
MARHLTDAKIASICEMVDGWDPATPLTWENLVAAVEGLLRHRYTRQALNAHERVRTAYAVRRNLLKNQPKKVPKGSNELVLQERIDRLRAENERLRTENERLLSKFVRWVYNASNAGLDEATLNKSMPPVDREQTRLHVIEDIRKQARE